MPPFELSIIFTANYAFLNYLVLSLGLLLLDDRVFEWIVPHVSGRWSIETFSAVTEEGEAPPRRTLAESGFRP